MALALALIVIVIGALAFHFVSPWWLTPLASNWQQMDDALLITLVICGIAFVAINLFIAWALIRFRHRDGVRASREHGNRKLEWWLIGLTTVGIVAMLAPGLSVYAKLISPPPDAQVFEVLGQQWAWHYRMPGRDGKLGVTDMRFVSDNNPFGMNPGDPNGQDDVMVADGEEMHILVNHPVKVLLRSKDVLHDFYVPQFRSRMNMVPGMVTTFWFTPIATGRFEVMCAQLCGISHFNMRSAVMVDDDVKYQAWLKVQPTFASLQLAAQGVGRAGTAPGSDLARQGQLLAQARGCVACHSVDGSKGVGPTWRGLYGKTETLADGKTVVADDAYLKESIASPNAKVVQGFPPVMPAATLSEQELAGLVAYIKSVKAGAGQHAATP